jgi:nicotinamidase-related amidase
MPDNFLNFPRSPELMSHRDTGLLVVDVQTKLMDLMKFRDQIVWNLRRLIDMARALDMPIAATEQYPKGIGPTVPELIDLLPDRPEKLTFSCCGIEDLTEPFRSREVHKILVAGIETHVCVQQTVYDLMAAGFRVFVPADAVGSRFKMDWQIALRRMDSAGATITTTEAALFECCETAEHTAFKQISSLAKQVRPKRKKTSHQ